MSGSGATSSRSSAAASRYNADHDHDDAVFGASIGVGAARLRMIEQARQPMACFKRFL